MEFHFKVTTWETIKVPKDLESLLLEEVKSGKIESGNEIYHFLGEITDEIYSDLLQDCTEQMSIEENGNNATIEVLEFEKEKVKTIWSNELKESTVLHEGLEDRINILKNMILDWGESDDPQQREDAKQVEELLPFLENKKNKLNDNLKLSIDGESINIYIDNGENKEPTHVVYWHEDEWIENPKKVTPAIIEAINLFYTNKKKLLTDKGY